jgi:hypothetical protein
VRYNQCPGSVRFFHASIVRATLALTLLVAIAPHARAEGECERGFAWWAKLSKARVRASPPSDDRGACLESEDVRRELLDGLARNRRACDSATSSLGQSLQQTKTMIDVNDGFIRSLGICPKEERAAVGKGWATKLQAAARKPTAPTGGCLELTHTKSEGHTLVNRHCAGHTVLAVVETRDADGKTACKTYSVSDTLPMGNDRTASLKVNHECVLNRGTCTSKRVGSMFPECTW